MNVLKMKKGVVSLWSLLLRIMCLRSTQRAQNTRQSVFRLFIALVIFFNTSFSFASAQTSNSSGDDQANRLVAQNLEGLTGMTPELQAHADHFDHLAKNPHLLEQQSVFHMNDQSVIIYDQDGKSKTYSFKDVTTTLEKPFIKSIRVRYDVNAKQVLIDGVTGADSRGEGGRVVATHIIPNLDVAHVINNDLVTVIVEKNGRVSSFPTSLAYTMAFTAPVPVFKNISMIKDMAQNPVSKIEFVHRAILPPQSKEQKEMLTAGDVHIIRTRGNDSQVETLPIVDILDKVVAGLKYLEMAIYLNSFDKEQFVNLEVFMKDLMATTEKAINEKDISKWLEGLSIEQLDFIRKIDPKQIENILVARSAINDFQKNPIDKFTLEEWQKNFEQLRQNAEKAYQLALQKQNNRSRLAKLMAKLTKRTSTVDPRDYIVSPENYEKFMTKNQPVEFYKKTRIEQMNELVNKFASSKITFFTLIAAPVAGYLAFPFAYEASQAMQDVKTLSYFYENFVPQVIKDIPYRSLLMISMSYQLLLIPLTYTVGFSIKYSVMTLAQVYKNSTSNFGVWVKNLAKDYRDISITQVLLTANNRFFAVIVIPYWKVLIEHIAGQKSFFKALQSGLNPFKTISPESEIGRKLGLESHKFVGLGLPHPVGTDSIALHSSLISRYTDKTKADQSLRSSIQNLLTQEKKDRNLAVWVLATMTISEKYNLDPAIILLAAQNKAEITLESVKKIMEDQKLIGEWGVLSNRLAKEFAHLSSSEVQTVLKSMDTELFKTMYHTAKNTAQAITKMSALRYQTELLAVLFKKKVSQFSHNILNIGDKANKFLSKNIVGKYVTKQVNQDYIFDQAMVTILPGLFGEMSMLDKPKYLMAHADEFLNTSKAQLFSLTSNIYGHLVGSGASLSLLFDSLQVVSETKYKPLEYSQIHSNEWSENIFKSAVKWVKFTIFSPTQSDVGGLALKKYRNRMDTIFASITFTYLARVMISNQSIEYAFTAYAIFFLISHSIYGYVWDFIVAGNKHIGDQAETNRKWLQDKQFELSRAIRFGETENAKKLRVEIIEAYLKNNPRALRAVIDHFNALKINEAIKLSLKDLKNKDAKAIDALGIATKLLLATHAKDEARTNESRAALLKMYEQNVEMSIETKRELEQLSNDGLLKLTQAIPPVATKENFALSWITSIGLGAILTTILATELAPKLMDKDFLSQDGILFDALVTCVSFTTSYYLAFGKKPHLFYQKVIEQVKQRAFRLYAGLPVFEPGEVKDYLATFLPGPGRRSDDLKRSENTHRRQDPNNSQGVYGSCQSIFAK